MNSEPVETWETRKHAVANAGGVVAAQHWRAARAGASLLARGGNAVDAAVGCAFALAACEPWMSGLGGSGFAVAWDAREARATAIDFQGTLAAGIDRRDYPLDPTVPDATMGFPGVEGNRNVIGYGAVSVPGAVRGLTDLHTRHGRLGLDTVLAPAIALAGAGLVVDWHTTLMIAMKMGDLERDRAAASLYLPDGCPPVAPGTIESSTLAATLGRLAEAGPDDFYEGRLAQSIAADLAAGGSPITLEDLAGYRARWIEPLGARHREAMLYTPGGTSGGPRLTEFLAHVTAHLDRSRGLGTHTWEVYAAGLARAWASHRDRLGQGVPEHGCTSHLSACDAEGNMVALTTTLLGRFGSCVVLPGTGITMNNAVSYFDPRPERLTSMAGGKRINASNMCPTLCVRDTEAYFAVGASGANAIMPATAQIAALLLDYGLDLEGALHSPRLDTAGDGPLRVDPRLGQATASALAREHQLEMTQLTVFPKRYGCPQAVMRRDGMCYGLSDPSHPIGGAAGPDL